MKACNGTAKSRSVFCDKFMHALYTKFRCCHKPVISCSNRILNCMCLTIYLLRDAAEPACIFFFLAVEDKFLQFGTWCKLPAALIPCLAGRWAKCWQALELSNGNVTDSSHQLGDTPGIWIRLEEHLTKNPLSSLNVLSGMSLSCSWVSRCWKKKPSEYWTTACWWFQLLFLGIGVWSTRLIVLLPEVKTKWILLEKMVNVTRIINR